MRRKGTLCLFFVIWLYAVGRVSGQGPDEEAAAGADAAAGGDGMEECEEAWTYVEFLKMNVKDKIEMILQDTLFKPKPLLEDTVQKTLGEVLVIREDILTRTKSIRSDDGMVKICPEQGIKQEEKLTEIRMSIMEVLLDLIDPGAATAPNLQKVGKDLLRIRSDTNAEITRMIMLRERRGPQPKASGDCGCGVLDQVLEGLNNVVKDSPVEAVGDEEAEAPAAGDEDGGDDSVTMLIMTLMDVDGEIKALYEEILGETDNDARLKKAEELKNLKEISNKLHDAVSDLHEEKDEEDKKKIIKRQVRNVRNDVKRMVQECLAECPGECKSCGAEKLDEITDKLADYQDQVSNLDENDAKESIRRDLMGVLTAYSQEMIDLLKAKTNNDNMLEKCENETLVVIDKMNGPLWMLVNVTIFGDAGTLVDMITAMEMVVKDLRKEYCAPTEDPGPRTPTDDESDTCDVDEINKAKNFITDIDTVISDSLFKTEDDEGRKEALLGVIDLKASMDNRVKELFQDNLRCKEEVTQIKNIYMPKLTDCLSELMNPVYILRYKDISRSERVACMKDLRNSIEERRGILLMREIERRIFQEGGGVDSDY